MPTFLKDRNWGDIAVAVFLVFVLLMVFGKRG